MLLNTLSITLIFIVHSCCQLTDISSKIVDPLLLFPPAHHPSVCTTGPLCFSPPLTPQLHDCRLTAQKKTTRDRRTHDAHEGSLTHAALTVSEHSTLSPLCCGFQTPENGAADKRPPVPKATPTPRATTNKNDSSVTAASKAAGRCTRLHARGSRSPTTATTLLLDQAWANYSSVAICRQLCFLI